MPVGEPNTQQVSRASEHFVAAELHRRDARTLPGGLLSCRIMKRRWTDVSQDPNSEAAHRYRLAQLRSAHQAPIASREDFFERLTKGKRVLDVGCIDHLD